MHASKARRNRRWTEALLILHLANVMCIQAVEKLFGAGAIELRILRLDAKEEAVIRGQRETRRVEHRMMRHGQFVERQHSENGGNCRAEDGQLRSHPNKHRPSIERASADVQGISD